MAAAPPPPPDPMHVPLRRRAGGIALALVANLVLLALLLGLTPLGTRPPPPARGINTFELSSEAGGQAARQTPTQQPREAPRVQATAQEAARVKTPPPAPVEAEVPKPLPMILLTPEQFATADIGRMPRGRGAGEGAGDQSASGGAGGSDPSVGRAPNGERLYKAEWYREPTHAELATYMPRGAPAVGWGVVACRTVAGYRVEDCAEVGESPQGSQLARAVRQAAWQFRVRPPRVGGRALVGAWVSIRIDYTQRAAGGGDDEGRP